MLLMLPVSLDKGCVRAFSPSPAAGGDFIVNTNFGFASSFADAGAAAVADSGGGAFSAASCLLFSIAFSRASSSSFTNAACFSF